MRLGAVPRGERTLPYVSERLMNAASRLRRRFAADLKEQYYGKHIVNESWIARSAEGIAQLVASAQAGEIAKSPALRVINLQSLLALKDLRRQAGGHPSNGLCKTSLPYSTWVGHQVKVGRDSSGTIYGRHLYSIRQQDESYGRFSCDTVQYYSKWGEEVVVVHSEEKNKRFTSRTTELCVRFARDGRTLLMVNESERGAGERIIASRRSSVVVGPNGGVLPPDSYRLYGDSRFFFQ